MKRKLQQNKEENKKRLTSFLGKIVDEIDFQRRNQEDVAKLLGISGGYFSKNLSGKSQFNFWNLIKLLNVLYGDDVLKKKEMLYEFCVVTTSKKNMRIAMEYANATGDLELLKLAVDKERKSSLDINREWSYVYELVWMRGKGILNGKELLKELEERKGNKAIKTKEMAVLLGILTFYTMYDLERFNSLFDYADMLQPKVKEIKNDFIRISYTGKIKEGLSYAYLMQDNVEKSRSLCHEILNEKDEDGCFSLLKASAYVYLAESYTFDSYERASWYIKKSLKMLGDCVFERMVKRRENILNTHAFIKLVHKTGLEDIKIYHPAEEAFLEIVKGNKKYAELILNGIKKKRGYLLPIEYCYLGLAKNDVKFIEKAIELFECEGNRFYCKFARKIMAEFNKNGIIYMGDAK